MLAFDHLRVGYGGDEKRHDLAIDLCAGKLITAIGLKRHVRRCDHAFV